MCFVGGFLTRRGGGGGGGKKKKREKKKRKEKCKLVYGGTGGNFTMQ